MKTSLWISAIAAPIFFTACDANKTSSQKMDAGKEKIAQGVKEVTDAAVEKTKEESAKANEKAKVAMDHMAEEMKKAKASMEQMERDMEKAKAEAEEKMDKAFKSAGAAVDQAKEKVEGAAGDAKEAVKEAVDGTVEEGPK